MSIVTSHDKVYVFIGDLEIAIFMITLFINMLFAYAAHDFLLPADAGTFFRFISGLGGLGYLLVFFLTSFALFFEGFYGRWLAVLIFELVISIASIAVSQGWFA